MGLKTEGEKLCFKGGLFSATRYVSLHTADPTSANELSGGGYARVAVAAAGWTVDTTSGDVTNAAAIAFPDPTADWSDPTHVGLWSAATGGNLLATVALTDDVSAPQTGNEVDFPAGELDFGLTTDD